MLRRYLPLMFMSLFCLAASANAATAAAVQTTQPQIKEEQQQAKKQAETERKAAAAQRKQEQQDQKQMVRMRQQISKLGVGEQAKLEVRMRDKTKLKGYLAQASEENFIIADSKTGERTTIAYKDVAEAKGKNSASGAKIALGILTGLPF